MYRPSQIDRAMWRWHHPPSELDRVKQKYFSDVDQDDYLVNCIAEQLLSSKESLNKIHIVWDSPRLPESFSGYWRNVETAILCTLRRAVYLHSTGGDFQDYWHSTNYLIQALQNPDWFRRPPASYPQWLRKSRYRLLDFEQYCQRNNASWCKYETLSGS